jgi:hypothetical protein
LKQKGLPRGKPFKKNEHRPGQFEPGQSGNPGGKPKVHQTMKMYYEAQLLQPAPDEICDAVGAPPKSPWGAVIAQGMCIRAALNDTSAAKEIREVTEGRIASVMQDNQTIDYSAGKTAREILMGKLEPKCYEEEETDSLN